jgi:endonuclease-3
VNALEVLHVLEDLYPEVRSHLDYTSPFELLIATILAAQCTDAAVNAVTPALFERYPGPLELAGADIRDLERLVHSTGFYRTKARNIRATAAMLVDRFDAEVPREIDVLTSFPGVGRKTANVVAGRCFGVPAIMVDTHLKRVVSRLALVDTTDPDRIEMSLRSQIPSERQTRFSILANEHGRKMCHARKPECTSCPLRAACTY